MRSVAYLHEPFLASHTDLVVYWEEFYEEFILAKLAQFNSDKALSRILSYFRIVVFSSNKMVYDEYMK